MSKDRPRKKPTALAVTEELRKRRCAKCGRKNARYNGDVKPLCGICFKPENLL